MRGSLSVAILDSEPVCCLVQDLSHLDDAASGHLEEVARNLLGFLSSGSITVGLGARAHDAGESLEPAPCAEARVLVPSQGSVGAGL
jgi:hypothetical protein